MSRVQDFLDELSDSELVSFFNYRYQEFLKGSKDKIDVEFEKRGISKDDLANYSVRPIHAQQQINEGKICPKCYSAKFYTSTEMESVNYSYASVEFEVDYKVCLVCLFSQEKGSNHESISYSGPFGFLRALINRKR